MSDDEVKKKEKEEDVEEGEDKDQVKKKKDKEGDGGKTPRDGSKRRNKLEKKETKSRLDKAKKKRREKIKLDAGPRRFCPLGVTDDTVAVAKKRCASRRQELENIMEERKKREMQKLLGGSLAPQDDFSLKSSSLAQSSYIVNTLNPEARFLTAKYTNMLTQERLSDVQFEMQGGEKAFAHIVVLLVRCPKLAEFVLSKKKKKNLKRQQIVVPLPATDEHAPAPFSRLLRFLYGEEIGISGLSLSLSTSLYLLARLYEVREVEIKVGILIRKMLSGANVLDVLKTAITAKDESLQEICFDYIHRNVQNILKKKDQIAEVTALDADVGKRLSSLSPSKTYDPYPVPNFMDVKVLQVADDWASLYERTRTGGDLEWTCDAVINASEAKQDSTPVPIHKAIMAAHCPEWAESWSWNSKQDDVTGSFLLSVPKAKGKKHVSPRPPSPPSLSNDKDKGSKDKLLKRSVSQKSKSEKPKQPSGLLSVARRPTRENLAELTTSKSDSDGDFLKPTRGIPIGEEGEEEPTDQLADDCLDFLLHYVYCVAARLDVWMTFQLLTFSKKMAMYDLSSLCESEIVNNMRPDTIVDTFMVAYNPATLGRKDMSYLRDICHNFLLKNVTAIDLDVLYAVDPRIAVDSLKFYKQIELKKKYTNLADVLVSNSSDELLIVEKLLDLNCDKGVAFALTKTFLLKDSMPSLLRIIFKKQVENNDDVFSFFRSSSNMDTMSRHILSNYFALVGTGYLISILRPVISAVCNGADCWEIDENRCPSGQSVEENLKNVTAVSNIFVAQLTSQQRSFPDLLKVCCTLLKEAMVGKFQEGIEEGIASFFFFNYFCPALLSPSDFGLWDGQVPPYALRGLILLSKVLNGMCSGVKFGPKEQYMTPLNGFIDENSKSIKKFYTGMLGKSMNELAGISLPPSSSAPSLASTSSSPLDSTSSTPLVLHHQSYVDLLTVLNCFFVQLSDYVKENDGKVEQLEKLKEYLKQATELE
eukprot:CAMPEP_0201508656 /NCGR_PEP_ID=MMETSP0161_2-20130828/1951_1 /ASSEMBLY_ACC=CAM_ASM_000251 /TAXON_ID=180227 /ORGANISM="Neoparamoeba aestuarina, Strain SoJaBio B1-5/56/2" /LENGTH=985 /DNA_ID=CAMNT_0047903387 /DNA_START=72 /DNA_END=3029 /DNA_ORIENTATION=-